MQNFAVLVNINRNSIFTISENKQWAESSQGAAPGPASPEEDGKRRLHATPQEGSCWN